MPNAAFVDLKRRSYRIVSRGAAGGSLASYHLCKWWDIMTMIVVYHDNGYVLTMDMFLLPCNA